MAGEGGGAGGVAGEGGGARGVAREGCGARGLAGEGGGANNFSQRSRACPMVHGGIYIQCQSRARGFREEAGHSTPAVGC